MGVCKKVLNRLSFFKSLNCLGSEEKKILGNIIFLASAILIFSRLSKKNKKTKPS